MGARLLVVARYPQTIRLVLETLEPLSDDRKCFRMINGVLVERTVKDVKPALQTNAEGLKKVLEDLVKQYKAKQDDLEKWKVGLNSILTKIRGGPRGKRTPTILVPVGSKAAEQITRFTNEFAKQKKNNIQVVQS